MTSHCPSIIHAAFTQGNCRHNEFKCETKECISYEFISLFYKDLNMYMEASFNILDSDRYVMVDEIAKMDPMKGLNIVQLYGVLRGLFVVATVKKNRIKRKS